jgi:hypothetical protein
MTDEELAADDLTRFRAGIEQLLAASKSQSRVNKLDGLTLQQFCERLLDPRMVCLACGSVASNGQCDCTRTFTGTQRLVTFAEAERQRLRAERRAG